MNIRLHIRLLACYVAEPLSVNLAMNNNGVAKREFPISSGQRHGHSVALLLRIPNDTFAVFAQCTSAFWDSRLHVIRLWYSGF